MALDATHSPELKSWVESANGHADFPIQNLPYGVYRTRTGETRPGVAIGDLILDLRAAAGAGLLEQAPEATAALMHPTLNRVLALPLEERRRLRTR